MAEGFVNDFKRFFIRGLAAVLPTLLTLAIIIYVFTFLQKYIGQYINSGVVYLAAWFWTRAADYSAVGFKAALDDHFNSLLGTWNRFFWWVGFGLAILGVYIFGRFVASFLGRGLWRMIEGAFFRFPLIKQIYPYVKQVTDYLFSERKIEFSRVVAVEYPRKGIWAMGLVTGAGMRTLHKTAGGDLLTIFIPSSPTPITGYTITVRRKDVIDLPISIDEALRFTISAGVIMPKDQRLSDAEIEQARQAVLGPPDKKESAT